MQTGLRCSIFRGGTSKGPYFLKEDMPEDVETRDAVLLAVMGSPDNRQIDGIGGADPLTSKVAIVSKSSRPDADIDYLFLQVVVNEARVDTNQNCGNILAGVGPFAIEQGLVAADDPVTKVRIHMVNTGAIAVAAVETPLGIVRYDGEARIDGVPGTHAPIYLDFLDIAGAACGALLPTGNAQDVIAGVPVTLIDNGMPVIVVRAADMGVTGYEDIKALEANQNVVQLKEEIRLKAGPMMNLGDVAKKNVPKVALVAPPQHGGALSTRSFIPHKVHDAIGVLAAVSVATAAMLPGSVAHDLANVEGEGDERDLEVEHPTGFFSVKIGLDEDGRTVKRAALLRTARKLMDGTVYIPKPIWSGTR
jgi:4-oxalomesaconate tautomerase